MLWLSLETREERWAALRAPVGLAWLVAMGCSGCYQADASDQALLEDPFAATSGTVATTQTGAADTAARGGDDDTTRWSGFACDSPVRADYHPPGYAESSLHGLETKLGLDRCTDCHGERLEGCNFAGGCDTCHDGGHPDGWRTSCTYCHGGQTNDTGAPPFDLDRDKPSDQLSFLAHEAHVVGTLHAPYACTQCHDEPADVLSAGHVFDDTPGAAEVGFAGGLSGEARYDGDGGCDNTYCHGNGRETGSVRDDASATDCNACHAFDDPTKLSGRHDEHVNGGLLSFLFDLVACTECHGEVVGQDAAIIGPALHVNGQVDLTIETQGITYDGTRCNGTCHGAPHTFISTWEP